MSIFKSAWSIVKDLLGVGQDPSVTQIAGALIGYLPKLIQVWHSYEGPDAKKLIDIAFDLADAKTGLEGPDIIHDLPPEAEERLFDGILTAGRELAYWAAGVYGVKPSRDEVFNAYRSVERSIARALPGVIDTGVDAEPAAS